MNDWSFQPQGGTVRLFPVPGLVMFPHVMQPLHIFEPRYRALLADALADDSLIAMPVLAAQHQPSEGPPPLEPVACLTKVVSHQTLPDGCSNLLVIGVARIRLVSELPAWEAYRQAEACRLDEQDAMSNDAQVEQMRERLLGAFKKHLSTEVEDLSCLDGLLDHELPLRVLTDLIAHTLPIDNQLKIDLLAETDVEHRAAMLQQSLCEPALRPPRTLVPAGSFPPGFSDN